MARAQLKLARRIGIIFLAGEELENIGGITSTGILIQVLSFRLDLLFKHNTLSV